MVLEQHIIESGEASIANASLVEMQQVFLKSFHPCGLLSSQMLFYLYGYLLCYC